MYPTAPQGPTRLNIQPSQAEVDSRFAANASENPDIAALTDRAIAEAAMHPEVLAAERRTILADDAGDKEGLAAGWLNLLADSGVPAASSTHETTYEQRTAEVYTPEQNRTYALGIAQITERIATIRSGAMWRGTPDYSRDDFTLAA